MNSLFCYIGSIALLLQIRIFAKMCVGFAPQLSSRGIITAHQMGFFDAISNAFSNEEYTPEAEVVKATARHILVKDVQQLELVKNELESGTSFNTVAQQYSTCPSSSRGGSLGSFTPGTMVKEFDAIIFDPETNIGEIYGPVETQFGYHMIVVDKRTS